MSKLWGLLLIIIGLIFGLNALEITNINIFFDGFWTLFIIVPCFIGLFKDSDKASNLIGVLIGVLLLLVCQNIISLELVWKLFFPAVLIVVGISIMFKGTANSKVEKEMEKVTSSNGNIEFCSTFREQNIKYDEKTFDGASVSAYFGELTFDLRDTNIKKDVIINAQAVFGSIKILVPTNVNIKTKGTPIFGSVENKVKKGDGSVTIYVNGSAIFGSIDIK